MKIIYKKQTGVLVSVMGEFSAPCEDEDIAEVVSVPMDRPPHFYRYNGAFVAPRHPSEVEAEMAQSKFSTNVWTVDAINELGAARVKALGSNFMLLQCTVSQKSWKESAAFIQEMLKDGDISQDELNKIKQCFLSQGIDINFFTPPVSVDAAPTPPTVEDK